MKHLLIALGLMSAQRCICDKHFNNPSLISGYSYPTKQHKPSKCKIKKSMELGDDLQRNSISMSLRDTMRFSNLR